ncbi:MAG TPA: ATP synthase F1 subunit delta [Bryobacteraceae bacterium]|jgi:F-type H+-transporting ATPase subunit delta|nr:ATP synthase F1 subunit delta [Bryobacteraceae bacterium]
MTSTSVVNRYGSALVDVALSPNSDVKPADAVAQLRAFDAAAKESLALRHVLASPAVSAQRKRAVIRRIADGIGASRVVRNFLLVLSDHRRAGALSEVIEAFNLLLDERLGYVRAEVRSASELTGADRDRLASRLGEIAGSKVRLRFTIDPELIGGVTAKIGSTVYDGSVRGQLADLRARLSSN